MTKTTYTVTLGPGLTRKQSIWLIILGVSSALFLAFILAGQKGDGVNEKLNARCSVIGEPSGCWPQWCYDDGAVDDILCGADIPVIDRCAAIGEPSDCTIVPCSTSGARFVEGSVCVASS